MRFNCCSSCRISSRERPENTSSNVAACARKIGVMTDSPREVTPVKVLEIAPPWVQTDLLGSNNEPRAMPLADFIKETMLVLGTDVEEVLVERAKPLRNNAGPGEAALVNQFNDMMTSPK